MTAGLARPCLKCGALSPGSYCRPCNAERIRARQQCRGTTKQLGYGSAWKRLSVKARRLQPFCSTCGASDDLTTDHITPLARSDRAAPVTIDAVQILCRSCNARKGAR